MRAWSILLALAPLAVAGVLGATVHPAAAPLPAPVPVFGHAAVDPAAPGSLLAVRDAAGKGQRFVVAPILASGPVQAEGWSLAQATLAPSGPRFGRDGMNATALTVHAFTDRGWLLASNDAASARGRFTQDGDFAALGPTVLYLGAGAAPNGTVTLPSRLAGLLPTLRAALAGQPEGGVVAVAVRSGILADLYGPTVHLALRVERLVLAP
ncbi:MAG: hypothetical protein QOI63_1984 [Thermoplasmata archaeon]|jgi:hypothetical protein|nr:hypothetical protein [Thermoplasmata archaeon]